VQEVAPAVLGALRGSGGRRVGPGGCGRVAVLAGPV